MTSPRGSLFILALLLICASATFPALAAPSQIPLAQVPEGLVHDTKYTVGQWRLLEAEAKARAWSKTLLTKELGTPNMALYDVTFYDLDLDLDHVQQILTGSVTVVAEVVGSELGELELNLRNALSVTEVRDGVGKILQTKHAQSILTVTLDRTYLAGETVTLEVDYNGNPDSDYFSWSSYDGQPMIWTLSEALGSSYWWPCKDMNVDKADSVTMHVTVDDPLFVATIGTLREVTVPELGRSTYHWHESYPIVPYLVSLAIHPFVITNDTYYPAEGDPIPMVYYTFPAYSGDVLGSYGVLNDMMAVFESVFGPYPFSTEKYGHAHFLVSGGMEHQTCSSMAYFAMNNSGYNAFYAHELAHQWFGDMITCADFHHLWLNEGFAVWSEAVWFEHSEGMAAYHSHMALARYLGSGTIYLPNIDNEGDIWQVGLVYDKASWVVHMLRHVLGEADFFTGLDLYLQQYAHGSATTEQFQAVMETVSGRDLSVFFQQWIYGEYFPVYGYSWNAEPVGEESMINLRIEQTQINTGLFEMPLDVLVTTDLGSHLFVVENLEQVEFYSFEVPGQVLNLEIDPDDWVLCEKSYTGATDVPPGSRVHLASLDNAPNPFNPATTISFSLPRRMHADLGVYDMRGRLVKSLVSEDYPAGENSVLWDGTDRNGQAVASGTYFALLRGEEIHQVKSLTLVR